LRFALKAKVAFLTVPLGDGPAVRMPLIPTLIPKIVRTDTKTAQIMEIMESANTEMHAV
jgi:hypothetical protein